MFYISILAALLVAYSIFRYYWNNRDLPPGPFRLPFIGNIHQLPEQNPWRTYQEWGKKYGPVFSLRVGLDTIIMLNDHSTARDLLDKRSNIYSSRPRLVMGGEVVSKGLRTLLMPYGPQWRTHQRLQASLVNVRESQKYTTLQDTESKQLIHDLLSSPDFSTAFHRFSSSLIYTLAYGQRLLKPHMAEDREIDQIMEGFLSAARVGTWIVDAIPVLNHLPGWLAPWKRHGAELHAFESKVYARNFKKGTSQSHGWNWSKQVSSMKESQEMPPLELAYSVGILYEAGSDTTTMAMEVFVLACLTDPAFIAKAQAELDDVVGDSRLPTYADKPDLPYINAVVNEVLRWRPVTAGGIPHATTQEDEYMGYRIPKGATVIGNHWAIHHDPEVYEEPQTFNPDRWVDHPDLPLAAFGFGRRVCTGQHIARNSIFINVARMLWAFDIAHAVVDGVKEEVDSLAMTQGFNSRPMPFKASFIVRSPARRAVVEKEWEAAEKDATVLLGEIKPDV